MDTITLATPRDLAYVESLSKKHADALGFLPRPALVSYIDRRRVTLARCNDDPVAYFLTGGFHESVRIFQACCQVDARHLRHAQRLLSTLISDAASHGTRRITLHCRDGLESNGFWSACGFQLDGLLLGGLARGRIVNRWTLDIAAAVTNPALPYAAAFLAHFTRRPPPPQSSPAFPACTR